MCSGIFFIGYMSEFFRGKNFKPDFSFANDLVPVVVASFRIEDMDLPIDNGEDRTWPNMQGIDFNRSGLDDRIAICESYVKRDYYISEFIRNAVVTPVAGIIPVMFMAGSVTSPFGGDLGEALKTRCEEEDYQYWFHDSGN